MSEHMFGTGPGWLSKQVERAAQREGADLCNHTDPGCRCGRGCASYQCPSCRRHWFAIPNRGEPYNGIMAQRVMAAVRAAATEADLPLLKGERK